MPKTIDQELEEDDDPLSEFQSAQEESPLAHRPGKKSRRKKKKKKKGKGSLFSEEFFDPISTDQEDDQEDDQPPKKHVTMAGPNAADATDTVFYDPVTSSAQEDATLDTSQQELEPEENQADPGEEPSQSGADEAHSETEGGEEMLSDIEAAGEQANDPVSIEEFQDVADEEAGETEISTPFDPIDSGLKTQIETPETAEGEVAPIQKDVGEEDVTTLRLLPGALDSGGIDMPAQAGVGDEDTEQAAKPQNGERKSILKRSSIEQQNDKPVEPRRESMTPSETAHRTSQTIKSFTRHSHEFQMGESEQKDEGKRPSETEDSRIRTSQVEDMAAPAEGTEGKSSSPAKSQEDVPEDKTVALEPLQEDEITPAQPDGDEITPARPDEDETIPAPPDEDETIPAPPDEDETIPAPPDEDETTPARPDEDETTLARPDEDETTPARPDEDETTLARPDEDETTPARPDEDETTPARPDEDETTPARPDEHETTALPDESAVTGEGQVSNIQGEEFQALEMEAGVTPQDDVSEAYDKAYAEDERQETESAVGSEGAQDVATLRRSKVEFDTESQVMLIEPLETSEEKSAGQDSESTTPKMSSKEESFTASGEENIIASDVAEENLFTSEAASTTLDTADDKSYPQQGPPTTEEDQVSTRAEETTEMSEGDNERPGRASETDESEREMVDLSAETAKDTASISAVSRTSEESGEDITDRDKDVAGSDRKSDDVERKSQKTKSKEEDPCGTEETGASYAEDDCIKSIICKEDEPEWKFIKGYVGKVLSMAYSRFKICQRMKAEEVTSKQRIKDDKKDFTEICAKYTAQSVSNEQGPRREESLQDPSGKSSRRQSQLQDNLWNPCRDMCRQQIMDYCKQKFLDPVFSQKKRKKSLRNDHCSRIFCNGEMKESSHNFTPDYPGSILDKCMKNVVAHNSNGWQGQSPCPYRRSGSLSRFSRTRSGGNECESDDASPSGSRRCPRERNGERSSRAFDQGTSYCESRQRSERTSYCGGPSNDSGLAGSSYEARSSRTYARDCGATSGSGRRSICSSQPKDPGLASSSYDARSSRTCARDYGATSGRDKRSSFIDTSGFLSATQCPSRSSKPVSYSATASRSRQKLKQYNTADIADPGCSGTRSRCPSFSMNSSRGGDLSPKRSYQSWHSICDKVSGQNDGGTCSQYQDDDDRPRAGSSVLADAAVRSRTRSPIAGSNNDLGSSKTPCVTFKVAKKKTRFNSCGGEITAGPYSVNKRSNIESLCDTCNPGMSRKDDCRSGNVSSSRPPRGKSCDYGEKSRSSSPGASTRLDAMCFESQRQIPYSSGRQSPVPMAMASGTRPYSQLFQTTGESFTSSHRSRTLNMGNSSRQYSVRTQMLSNSVCPPTGPSFRAHSSAVCEGRNSGPHKERTAPRDASSGLGPCPSHLTPAHFSSNATHKNSQLYESCTEQNQGNSPMRMSTRNSRDNYQGDKSSSRVSSSPWRSSWDRTSATNSRQLNETGSSDCSSRNQSSRTSISRRQSQDSSASTGDPNKSRHSPQQTEGEYPSGIVTEPLSFSASRLGSPRRSTENFASNAVADNQTQEMLKYTKGP